MTSAIISDRGYVRRMHSKSDRQGLRSAASSKRCSDGSHVVTGELASPDFTASAFRKHVSVVVPNGTQKQMIGTNASTVITSVQDAVPWEFSHQENPCGPMRSNHSQLGNTKLSVSICGDTSSPFPASSKTRNVSRDRSALVDLQEKGLKRVFAPCRFGYASIPADHRAENLSLPFPVKFQTAISTSHARDIGTGEQVGQ